MSTEWHEAMARLWLAIGDAFYEWGELCWEHARRHERKAVNDV